MKTLSLPACAKHLGLTRQRLYQLRQEDRTFPVAVDRIANADLFSVTEFREWARRHGRVWS